MYKLVIALVLSLPAAAIFVLTLLLPSLFSEDIVLMIFEIAIPAFVEMFILFCGLQQSLYRKIGTVLLKEETGAFGNIQLQNGPNSIRVAQYNSNELV